MSSTFISILFLLSTTLAASTTQSVEALASNYALTSSTSFPFPTATLSSIDTEKLLVSRWSVDDGRLQDGQQNLAFVDDPFPSKLSSGAPASSSPSGPVLRVTYPEGSYSHDTGGAQFYSLWNTTDGSSFRTMMVSYELAFNSTFDWVKGGKLPGLRGGLSRTGCSGGNRADGLSCFTTRLMWRKDGDGEVYAYIPTSDTLCSQKSVLCNADYGVSVQRKAYNLTMARGQWMRLTLLVQLNNPSNKSNGHIQLFVDDALVISQSNLTIRAADSVAVNGFYFSTFFGGSDSSWATPLTTHTYFRNIRLWGSSKDAVNLIADTKVNGGPSLLRISSIKVALSLLVCIAGSVLYL